VSNNSASGASNNATANVNVQPALTNISTAVGPDPARILSEALKTADHLNIAPQPVNAAIAPKDDAPPPMMVKTTEASAAQTGPTNAVELRLMPERGAMLVGEKQRVALALATKESLGTATIKLRFDPRVIAVRGVSQGSLLAGAPANTAPTLMQSIDPSGALLISVQTPSGTPLKTGMNIMLFIEVEALAGGESEISFDKDVVRLANADGRAASMLFVPGRIAVKQQ
jgi:hypothetical protein